MSNGAPHMPGPNHGISPAPQAPYGTPPTPQAPYAMPSTPQYQQLPAQSQPGMPYQQPQMFPGYAPYQINPFANFFSGILGIFKNTPEDAVLTTSTHQNTSWTALGIVSAIAAFAGANLYAAFYNIRLSVFGSLTAKEFSAGEYFKFFILAGILAALAFLVRAACLMGTMKLRRIDFPFAQATGLASVSFAWLWAAMTLASFIMLLGKDTNSNSTFIFLLVLLLIVFSTFNLLGENILYGILKKLSLEDKTLLLHHILFTALYWLFICFEFWIISKILKG